jgi:hypothetical protein
MERAHKPLHLDKLCLTQWKVMDMPTGYIWIILSDEAYKYGDRARLWGYVGTNANQCV